LGIALKETFGSGFSVAQKIFLQKVFPAGYNPNQFAGRAYCMQLMEVLDTTGIPAARNHPDPLRRIRAEYSSREQSGVL